MVSVVVCTYLGGSTSVNLSKCLCALIGILLLVTGASPISEKSLVDSPDDEVTVANSEDREGGEEEGKGDQSGKKEEDTKGICTIVCVCV